MIKSLLDADEEIKKTKDKPENIKEIKTDSAKEEEPQADVVDVLYPETASQKIKTEDEAIKEGESLEEIKSAIEFGVTPNQEVQAVKPFEVNRPIGKPKSQKEETEEKVETQEEKIIFESPKQLELEKEVQKIEEELLGEKKLEEEIAQTAEKKGDKDIQPVLPIDLNKEDIQEKAEIVNEENKEPKNDLKEASKVNITRKDFVPDSKFETMRKTGLAWSGAIILFGSVVFMMVIGWFVDLLLGSKPWGLVGGIVLGSLIGFIQFFRTTTQIFKPAKSDFEKTSLKANYDKK